MSGLHAVRKVRVRELMSSPVGHTAGFSCNDRGPPTEAALLISNNAGKLFFQPCVLLLKGFDDVLPRRAAWCVLAASQLTRCSFGKDKPT
jgi:hypothetical protein